MLSSQVLIQDDPPTTENDETAVYSSVEGTTDGGAYLDQPLVPNSQNTSTNDYTYGRNANYTPRNGDFRIRETGTLREITNGAIDLTNLQDTLSDGFYDGGSINNDPRLTRPQYQKFCKRTVLLSNLPEGATHADVVDNVRGGMLLDIFLRSHDKAASVSFLEETQAQEFFRHVKRNDLYSEFTHFPSNSCFGDRKPFLQLFDSLQPAEHLS